MDQGLPKDLFAGDPGDIERELDEWVAGFERNAQWYQELRQRVDDVRLTATSSSGVVTVTVDANGMLTDARFTDRIGNISPDELSRQLLDAVNRAKAGIVGKVRAITDETLGGQGGDSADRIVGYYSERFASAVEPEPHSPAPRPPARRATGEADDSGEDTVFDH